MAGLAMTLIIAVILGFVWTRSYLQFKKRAQEREMIHRERMLAMEKGIPLPEFPVVELEPRGSLLDYVSSHSVIPKFSLALGILLVFGGVGLMAALMLSPRAAHEAWSFGFIPLFLRTGFVLYYFVSRSPGR